METQPSAESEAPQGDAVKRRTLLVAFVTMFLDLLGFGLIIPIQPFYAQSFDASPTMVTMLGAAYSLMQFIFIPFWGRLSDRVGRRPVIMSSVLISGLGYIAFATADSLLMLFLARLMSGFGNANIATVQAMIADTTTGAERTKGMGLVGAAFGLGFVFGPAVGGVLVQWGLETPAWAAAGLTILNLLLAIFVLPETNKFRRVKGDAPRPKVSRKETFKLAMSLPNVALIAGLMAIWSTGFAVMEQSISLFIEAVWVTGSLVTQEALASLDPATIERLASDELKKAAGMSASVLVVVGATSAVLQGLLIGPLSRRFGERPLIRVGMPVAGLGMLMIIAAGRLDMFVLMFPASMLLAAGTGLCNPVLMSLLSQSSPANVQGSILGVGQSAGSLGRVIGPAISGFLFSQSIEMPAAVGGALLFCAFLLTFQLKKVSHPPVAPSLGGLDA